MASETSMKRGVPPHRGDIAQVGDGRPVSDVFPGGQRRIEMNTFRQQVRRNERPLGRRGLEDGAVVADSLEHQAVRRVHLCLEASDQPEFTTHRASQTVSTRWHN